MDINENKTTVTKEAIAPGKIVEANHTTYTNKCEAWHEIFNNEVLSVDSIIEIFRSSNDNVKNMLRRFLDALYCAAHSDNFDFDAIKDDFDKLLDKLDSIEVAP